MELKEKLNHVVSGADDIINISTFSIKSENKSEKEGDKMVPVL